MNDYAIRVATPRDRIPVTALLRASYPTLMARAYDPAVLAGALDLMTAANPNLLASGKYYIAVADDGSPVGCGGWSTQRPGTGTVVHGLAHLRHFATHPAWTRKGVGHAIGRRCIEDAGSAGISRIECYSSLNAERFYTGLGFAVVRRTDLELAPGVRLPGVVLWRPICGPRPDGAL